MRQLIFWFADHPYGSSSRYVMAQLVVVIVLKSPGTVTISELDADISMLSAIFR